ncbi:MAG: glycolate oxidase subunit GlcE [Gammaproteobacteria bacterium]|nr:glycolate oxidase subunit GlcE [Gammaproteobacteria bacterium]NNJ49928.1 glycolate oxidase subunit GlcE [Gammaproteobacteria bacterium]
MNSDISQQLQQQVQHAFERKAALSIFAGNSKAFYGRSDARAASAEILDVSGHRGVLNYEPTELVITARAGTPLREIEKLLEENGQMLPFEPPAFSDNATIGGTIACNLSGPRRAYTGAARDFLLGCKIINGKGEILSFGGEVMKNVAGYDVSRLMAGAMGTLGILLEVSLKVLPVAEMESTQLFQCTAAEALDRMHAWSQTPLPLSASSYHDSTLRVRLSGATEAVKAAVDTISGETVTAAEQYWQQLREQRLDFFTEEKPLWRISLASDTVSLGLPADYNEDNCLYEWGGALRWLKSDAPAETIQYAVAELDGHATLFRHDGDNNVFQPLTPGLMRIHQNLKQAFDPENILNPGKLYPEL